MTDIVLLEFTPEQTDIILQMLYAGIQNPTVTESQKEVLKQITVHIINQIQKQ